MRSQIPSSWLIFIFLVPFLLILVLCRPNAYGAQVTFAWEPNTEPDVSGYKLFCRQDGQPYNYDAPAWEGTEPTCTYEFDAVVNTTYCFVVRAFDTSGNESSNSNEACWTAPPFVLEGLSITGPASVNEDSTASYTAMATFSNGDTMLATKSAIWSVDPSTYASISSGRLTTLAVPGNETVTIRASYTFGLVTKAAAPNGVTIVDVDDDSDGDGMPDWWEIAHGLDPTSDSGINGRDGDFDNDGCTNYEEYINRTNPADDTSPVSTPPEVREVNPHHNAGINDTTRIANNTSFGVRIDDSDGIDITDTSSIKFTINDSVNPVYKRDLSDATVIRIIKLTSDPDTAVTKLWAVYDRSMEATYGTYSYDTNINIKVDAKDRRDDWMRQTSYDFNIETETEHNDAQANLPDTGPLSPTDLAIVDAEHTYDVGIEVTGGDLKGAKIVYDSSEPVQPTFGPTAEVPLLDVPDVDAVGVPVNLQPPTVFTTAVKIFIPCAGQTDASNLCVYLYNGTDYVLACDADGNVQPGGEGWMVPDSRVDHPETNPPSIEIKVYHFTGVQAGVPSSSDSGAPGGGGECFIATAAFGSYAGPHINVLRDFRDEYLLTNGPGRWFVRTYYRYGSYVADYMNTHTWCKPLVRFALMPVVGLSYVMVKTSLEPSFLAAALLLAAFILTCFIRNQLSTRFERN